MVVSQCQKNKPNFLSAFWRIVYFITGAVLMISGRLWMNRTDEATLLPFLVSGVGFGLAIFAVRVSTFWKRL